jgi:hypothetical protein
VDEEEEEEREDLEDMAQIKELPVSVPAHIDVAFALAFFEREGNTDERGLRLMEPLGGQEDLEKVLSMEQALGLKALHHLHDELESHCSVLWKARSGVALLNDHLLDIDLLGEWNCSLRFDGLQESIRFDRLFAGI